MKACVLRTGFFNKCCLMGGGEPCCANLRTFHAYLCFRRSLLTPVCLLTSGFYRGERICTQIFFFFSLFLAAPYRQGMSFGAVINGFLNYCRLLAEEEGGEGSGTD